MKIKVDRNGLGFDINEFGLKRPAIDENNKPLKRGIYSAKLVWQGFSKAPNEDFKWTDCSENMVENYERQYIETRQVFKEIKDNSHEVMINLINDIVVSYKNGNFLDTTIEIINEKYLVNFK